MQRRHLLDETRQFYTQQAAVFAQTRQQAWPGWMVVADGVQPDWRILDVGCGNGRFLGFLKRQQRPFGQYTGVDYAKPLLAMAQKRYPDDRVRWVEAEVMRADLSQTLASPFDLTVAFGFMHHLPDVQSRKLLLKQLIAITTRTLVVSWWQPERNWKFKKSALALETRGDYVKTFGATGGRRFIHHFTDEEIGGMIVFLSSFGKVVGWCGLGADATNVYTLVELEHEPVLEV